MRFVLPRIIRYSLRGLDLLLLCFLHNLHSIADITLYSQVLPSLGYFVSIRRGRVGLYLVYFTNGFLVKVVFGVSGFEVAFWL